MTAQTSLFEAPLAPAAPPAPAGLFDNPAVIPGRTLQQPFAGAVLLAAFGYPAKDIETRLFQTTLRGEFVIVAGLEMDPLIFARVRGELIDRGIPPAVVDNALGQVGVALVVARIALVRPLTEADYSRALHWKEGEKRWAWELADLCPLEPFKVSGKPGFFPIQREVVARARRPVMR